MANTIRLLSETMKISTNKIYSSSNYCVKSHPFIGSIEEFFDMYHQSEMLSFKRWHCKSTLVRYLMTKLPVKPALLKTLSYTLDNTLIYAKS